jgi:hypothetical protein
VFQTLAFAAVATSLAAVAFSQPTSNDERGMGNPQPAFTELDLIMQEAVKHQVACYKNEPIRCEQFSRTLVEAEKMARRRGELDKARMVRELILKTERARQEREARLESEAARLMSEEAELELEAQESANSGNSVLAQALSGLTQTMQQVRDRNLQRRREEAQGATRNSRNPYLPPAPPAYAQVPRYEPRSMPATTMSGQSVMDPVRPRPAARTSRPARGCLSYSDGSLRNSCSFPVNYSFCWLGVNKNSWASHFNCELQRFGAGKVGAGGSSLVGSGNRVFFGGCEDPAFPTDSRWTGSGVEARCF